MFSFSVFRATRYYQSPNRNDAGGYRPGAGGYDRNDNRQNYQDYRGNGYDNRDPAYFNSMNSMRGGGNRGYGNRENSYESYYDGNHIKRIT